VSLIGIACVNHQVVEYDKPSGSGATVSTAEDYTSIPKKCAAEQEKKNIGCIECDHVHQIVQSVIAAPVSLETRFS